MAEYRPGPGTTERRDPRQTQLGCICAVLGLMAMLLLASGYVCLFRSVPLRISKETTYITEPLKPDGKQVDYFAAWEEETYPENIATEQNGYRLIVRHLGMTPEPGATPASFAQLCEKLGLDAESIQSDMTFDDPDSILAAYIESEDSDGALVEKLVGHEENEREPLTVLDDRLHRPWTLDDLPMMETWLRENGPAIDLIGEAVRKPTFHIPLTTDDGGQIMDLLLPEAQHTRSFARALNARANYRIATGDIDGAIDDIITCKRLGRHIGHGLIVQMLIGIAIEGMADSIGVAGSLEHPPTKQQLKRSVAELDNLPPRGDFEEAFLFERYAALDILQAMAHGGEWVLSKKVPRGIGLDWNIVARRVNENYDGLLGSRDFPTVLNPKAIVSLRARSEMMGDEFSWTFLPACEAAREAGRRSTCAERMQRITLAMLLYERDHGTLPPAYTADADGKPLHSWRVLLLPYLGQRELYDKIRLDEPWDSEHNRQFQNTAVPFYQCPSEELAPHHTTYSVVVGPDVPFEAGKGKTLSQFGPKSARMILVVERTEAVGWMDPTQDVPQAAAERGFGMPDRGGFAIGSQHPGGANFGHRDGAVRFLAETLQTDYFKGLLQGTADGIP